METIEAEIEKFLEKWTSNTHQRGQMDIDLHFFMRTIMKEHDKIVNPESYTPARKHNL